MIAVEKIAQTLWREDVASRSPLADSAFGYACNTHNQRAVSASCSIDYLAPAFALFRGHCATVKGKWIE